LSTAATRSRADATATPFAWVLALTVLGGVLRFATLSVQSFWNDEAVTATLLHQGFFDMLRTLPASESTPPLYYLLAWLWTQVFGLGEAGLRSLSAVAGTLTIPVAYWIAWRMASARAGLAAAALVAVNPLLWWYSQEARSYALVVLLTALATAAFVDLVQRDRRVWTWAVAAALAVATHYFAVFVVLPQAAWLGRRAWKRRWPGDIGALAVVAATSCALLPLAIRQASNHGAQFIDRSGSLAFRLGQVPKQFLIGFDAPFEVAAGVAAGAAALTALALLVARSDRGERNAAVVAGSIAAIAVGVPGVAALVGIDYLITRNLIPALVPVLIVLALGFGVRNGGRVAVLAGGVLCSVSLATIIAVSSDASYQRDNWRRVARELGPAQRDRVVVITPADGAVALRWYLPGAQTTGGPVTAQEIDAVGVGERVAGQKPRPPRGPVAIPAGFTLVKKVDRPTFTLVSLRAGQPMSIDYGFANEQRLGRNLQSALLYQTRARSLGAGD
jgi:mannosyltransferase